MVPCKEESLIWILTLIIFCFFLAFFLRLPIACTTYIILSTISFLTFIHQHTVTDLICNLITSTSILRVSYLHKSNFRSPKQLYSEWQLSHRLSLIALIYFRLLATSELSYCIRSLVLVYFIDFIEYAMCCAL